MPAPLLVQLRDLVREFGAATVTRTLVIGIWEGADGRPDPRTRSLYHALEALMRRHDDLTDPMPDPRGMPEAYAEWCDRQYGGDYEIDGERAA
jgi:hypothetical protein